MGGDRRRLGSDDRTDGDWRRDSEDDPPFDNRGYDRRRWVGWYGVRSLTHPLL